MQRVLDDKGAISELKLLESSQFTYKYPVTYEYPSFKRALGSPPSASDSYYLKRVVAEISLGIV